MLNCIKVHRPVSIITVHHQGVGLTLLKLLNYLKNTEFKILKINPGVVAAIHVAGVRGDTCGAVRTHSTTLPTLMMHGQTQIKFTKGVFRFFYTT